jgi:Na+/H+ antiporter NhaD/arsenite permease-like protein
MSPATISLLALLAVIVLSMISRLNIGLVAIAMAWLIGVFVAGQKTDAIIAGFPSSLFLTLAGVTLLFACAESNGTLKALTGKAVRVLRGRNSALPLLFFLLAFLLSAVGPGAISSVALVAPLAMAIARREGISAFLTALMVGNGANAGNLSPISSVGVIANAKMSEVGLGGHEWNVFLANLAAHALVGMVAYAFWRKSETQRRNPRESTGPFEPLENFTRGQWGTVIVILVWIAGVLIFKANLGLCAFVAAAILLGFGVAEERNAINGVPWGIILMVCGVSLMIALLEKTGGMELFTSVLARMARPGTVNGVIAFVTGAISTYSSTSGVVLPAFLPSAPRLVSQLGGGDPLAIALSINVGSALVDVSPLSTLGALCVATQGDATESHQLFRRLLVWGLSMTLVGALFCQLFCGFFARI